MSGEGADTDCYVEVAEICKDLGDLETWWFRCGSHGGFSGFRKGGMLEVGIALLLLTGILFLTPPRLGYIFHSICRIH